MFNHQEFCFHESSIIQFEKTDNIITITLDEVDYQDKKAQVKIECINIKTVETDGNITRSNYMKNGDGEILTLNFQDRKIELIIQWHDHILKSHDINFYYISCDKIKVSLLNTNESI